MSFSRSSLPSKEYGELSKGDSFFLSLQPEGGGGVAAVLVDASIP